MAASSSNIASTGIVLESLRKDNYDDWSTLVRNYLVGKDLWHGIVIEVDPNKEKDSISKNAMALHAIQLACGSENLSKIRDCETARKAWNQLKISFSNDVRAYPDIEQGRDTSIYHLHSNVKRGYWNDAKSDIISDPDLMYSTTSTAGKTILHVAVASGQDRIVNELVSLGNQRLLRMQDRRGYTALALAAELTDNTKMAERMVSKGGKELLRMKTKFEEQEAKEDDKNDNDNDNNEEKGEIPVLLAAAKGHKQMTKYLFSHTPIQDFFENDCRYGVLLLQRCIDARIFDIAAFLLQHRLNRVSPLTKKSKVLRRPIHALAHMSSAFRSGSQLGWWQQFIYNSLKLQTRVEHDGKSIEIVLHVESDDEEPNANANAVKEFFATPPLDRIYPVVSVILLLVKHFCRGFEKLKHVIQTSILRKLPGSEKIYEKKKDQYLALEILRFMSKGISRLDESELHECSAYDTMLQAAKCGIIEFIDSMRHANPDLLWAMDKNKLGIFSHAILNRQEKVFQLIHEIEGHKEMIAYRQDVFGYNMLHLAAELGPSSDLSSRSNAALQMQRELHWYKAVEEIVPAKCKEAKNGDGKTPWELFSKNHEELVKSGEKWARDTASSFTLVGTLIITIMFAAAFTVPGGNDQNSGIPIFLRKNAFKVFILADAISLVTSSSSVLIFIGILTSRYAEKDFLRSLPLKLLFGLITLFYSVASMMLAFVAALSMMLKGHRGVVIAAMVLATIPVIALIPTLLSLSVTILRSTWRPTLLTPKKKKKSQDDY